MKYELVRLFWLQALVAALCGLCGSCMRLLPIGPPAHHHSWHSVALQRDIEIAEFRNGWFELRHDDWWPAFPLRGRALAEARKLRLVISVRPHASPAGDEGLTPGP